MGAIIPQTGMSLGKQSMKEKRVLFSALANGGTITRLRYMRRCKPLRFLRSSSKVLPYQATVCACIFPGASSIADSGLPRFLSGPCRSQTPTLSEKQSPFYLIEPKPLTSNSLTNSTDML